MRIQFIIRDLVQYSVRIHKGIHSNKSTYQNQQLTFKNIDLLVLVIIDYIDIGWN